MKAVRIVGATVCLLIGLVWIGQGIGLIRGSSMTGHPGWSGAGVVLLAIAIWQLVLLLRAGRA